MTFKILNLNEAKLQCQKSICNMHIFAYMLLINIYISHIHIEIDIYLQLILTGIYKELLDTTQEGICQWLKKKRKNKWCSTLTFLGKKIKLSTLYNYQNGQNWNSLKVPSFGKTWRMIRKCENRKLLHVCFVEHV